MPKPRNYELEYDILNHLYFFPRQPLEVICLILEDYQEYYANKQSYKASVHGKLEMMEHYGLVTNWSQHKSRVWSLTPMGRRKAEIIFDLPDRKEYEKPSQEQVTEDSIVSTL